MERFKEGDIVLRKRGDAPGYGMFQGKLYRVVEVGDSDKIRVINLDGSTLKEHAWWNADRFEKR
jgi:hypothetical protein